MKGHGLFSIDRKTNELLVLDSPVTDSDLEEVKTLRKAHIVPDYSERSLYQSLIFAITNQRTTYEQATRFMQLVAGADLDYIKDSDLLFEIAKEGEARLGFRKNKYKEPFEFIESTGGIEKVVRTYLEDPYGFRNELTKVNWIGPKTASLWYTCLGGDEEILCLDVHVMRQCAPLGITVDEKYFIAHPRISKEGLQYRSTSSLPTRLYYVIENQLLEVLRSGLPEKYPDLTNRNGRIDGPFASLLLWWLAAKDFRSEMRQLKLFPEVRFDNPYVA